MTTQPTLFEMPKHEVTGECREVKRGVARLKKACRNQLEVNVSSLNDLIPIDHPVRHVWEYVEKLDLSKCLNHIKSVEGAAGRPAIDPAILVTLWLYAIIEGIGSAYVLAEYATAHIAFRWICGGVSIDRKTISQFRVENGKLFEDVLAQGIAVLARAGAIKLEEIAQDGLRVRASAGRGSFKKKKTIEEHYIQAKQRIDRLRAELEENPKACRDRQAAAKINKTQDRLNRLQEAQAEFQKYSEQSDIARKKHKKKVMTLEEKEAVRISTTDPEARIMKMPDGGFRPAYNFQFAVDTHKNIILSTSVVNAGTDNGEMGKLYDAIKQKFNVVPTRYLADGGFKSPLDITRMTKDGCSVFLPVQEGYKKGKAKAPYEPKKNESEEMGHWRARMGTEEGKKIYRNRASTVELVNANVRGWGLYQVSIRGLAKVTGIATMYAAAYNMIRTISLGVV